MSDAQQQKQAYESLSKDVQEYVEDRALLRGSERHQRKHQVVYVHLREAWPNTFEQEAHPSKVGWRKFPYERQMDPGYDVKRWADYQRIASNERPFRRKTREWAN
jgi:hypothetical protein